MTANTLRVLDIQRLSTEDGPGLRTTIFTKGCPLTCAWCHNPESIAPAPQVIWNETHCMGCGLCLKACENQALTQAEKGFLRNAENCTGCAQCAEICPTGAQEAKGEDWPVEKLLREVLKDKAYFSHSKGGITLSGGDPMQQYSACAALAKGLQNSGVSVALDSALLTTQDRLSALLPYVDIVLLDLKLADNQQHIHWTQVPNTQILENAKYIAQQMRRGNNPSRLWIRTPIIPGATDTPQNITAIGNFIAQHLNDVFERWELCAFNNLCRDKYTRLGIAWHFSDAPLMRKEQMETLLAAAKQSGASPQKIFWTGSAQMEKEDS